MVTAAAIGTLVELAPGRVNVAIGSGFTGRLTLGQKPLPWTFVREYVLAVQGLLAGETVEWDGAPIRMLHPDGFGAPRPISVPIILGTGGPKGEAVAREIGDGVFVTSPTTAFDWCSVLTLGTVLDDGEDPGSDRAMAAAGHAGALAFHAIHLRGSVTSLPGGDVWLAALRGVPRTRAPPGPARGSSHRGQRARPARRDR